jgi:NADH-quinone oxidoreductase subunit A
MRLEDVLLSPPVTVLLFLVVFVGVYWLGSRFAPKFVKVGGKTATYACGEDLPPSKITVNYRLFFYVALFFTIMHVAVLVVATVPPGMLALVGLVYLAMIFLSVMALITRD